MSNLQIFFFDSRLDNVDALISQLPEGSVWYILPESEDGLAYIESKLQELDSVNAVHIVTHGSDGFVQLGSTTLTSRSLTYYEDILASIGDSLTESGDILLYGCNVASTEEGQDFVESLAQITGADVAASTDLTGLNGDSELEYQSGSVEATALDVSSANVTLQTVQFSDESSKIYADSGEGDTEGGDILYLGAGSDYLEAWNGGSDEIYAEAGDDVIWTDAWYYQWSPTSTIPTDRIDFIDGGDGSDKINIDTWGGLPLAGNFEVQLISESQDGLQATYRVFSADDVKQDFLLQLNANGSGSVAYNYSAPTDPTQAPFVFLNFVNVEAIAFNSYDQTLGSDSGSERWAYFSLKGDKIVALSADNLLIGGNGEDFINGTSGNDAILTEDGGWDRAWGNEGEDTLVGGDSRDFLFGGADDDIIDAKQGDDFSFGGAGNDTIINNVDGGGSDFFDGGEGIDTLKQDLSGLSSYHTVTIRLNDESLGFGTQTHQLEDGSWTTYGDSKTDALISIENVDLSATGSNAANVNIYGDDGANHFRLGAENDWISAGDGNDTIIGGGGWDTVSYLYLENAIVNVNLASSSATVTSIDGATTFEVDEIIDVRAVEGSAGNDVIRGNANSNFLIGREGDDLITGGGTVPDSDSDTVSYEYLQSTGVTIDLLNGTALTKNGSEYDTLVSIENAHGTHQADTIKLSDTGGYTYARSGDDTLTGGSGDDRFLAGVGNDSIDGAGGTDRVVYFDDGYEGSERTQEGIVFNSNGTVTDLWGNTDTLTNIEIVEGSQFNDQFYGTSGNDWFEGGDGSDHLHGNAGNDMLDGGDDSNGWGDYANYYDAAKGVTVNLAAGQTTQDGFDGVDTLINIENVEGSQYNDNLTGDTGQNWFRTWKGSDTVDGGAGNDLIFYSHIGASWASTEFNTNISGVTVDLGAVEGDGYSHVTYQIDGIAYTDYVKNIENLHGTEIADNITLGDSGAYVFGEGGDDFLTGGDGSDNFFGGQGDDVIDGGAGRDRVSYTEGTALQGINADLGAGYVNDQYGNVDTVTNVEDLSGTYLRDIIRGSWLDNSLEGKDGDDDIYAHGGNDYVDGGAGNDRLWGDQGNDTLIGGDGRDEYWGGEGDDLIDASYYNSSNDNDFVGGSLGNDTIIGNKDKYWEGRTLTLSYESLNNVGGLVVNIDSEGQGTAVSRWGQVNDNFSYVGNIILTMENDIMMGADNNRHEDFYGLAGNDYFDGRGGDGHLMYEKDAQYGGNNAITIDFSEGYAIDGFGDRDTFVNIKGMRGTLMGDLAIGNGDQDYVFYQTLGGNDTVVGSDGWDMLWYWAEEWNFGGQLGIEAHLDQGYIIDTYGDRDTVSKIDRVEGTNFNDWMQAGDERIEFDGRNGDDTLIGGTASDKFWGGDGRDELYGGAGDDSLYGGGGDDYLEGGSGENHMYSDSGNDVIYGGDDRDHIGGGGGRDTIYAGGGDDYIDAVDYEDFGSGNEHLDDFFDGGEGADSLNYEAARSGVIVNLEAGAAYGLATGFDTISNIERVNGSFYDDILIGTSTTEWESFSARGGMDIIIGQGGNDNVFFGSESSGIFVDLSKQFIADTYTSSDNPEFLSVQLPVWAVAAKTGGDSVVYMSGIESVIGTLYSDEFIGSSADEYFALDWWDWDGHPNTLNGGSDTVDGGDGFDEVHYKQSDFDMFPHLQGIEVDLADVNVDGYGWARDQAGNIDFLKSIERIVGTEKRDVIRGSDANEHFIGNGGNDHIEARGGDDIIDTSFGSTDSQPWGDYVMAGLGHDTIIGHQELYESGDGIDISYQDIVPVSGFTGVEITVDGLSGAGSGTVKSIGDGATAINDTFTFTHFFHGSEGNDLLQDSVPGQDHGQGWSGYEGNDTIHGGEGFDTLLYSHTRGNETEQGVSVNFQTGLATDQWGFEDTFSGIEKVRGSALNDFFVGSDQQQVVVYAGLAGSDTIVGTSGRDELDYRSDADHGGQYGILAQLEIGRVSDGFGDIDTVSQIDSIRATDSNDLIYAWVEDAANYQGGPTNIEGMDINTFDGDDTVYGSAGRDNIRTGDGDDYIDTSVGSAVSQNYGDFIQAGLGSDTIIGNESLWALGDGIDISYQDISDVGGLTFTISAQGQGTVRSGIQGLVNDTFTYTHFFLGSNDGDVFVSTSEANFEGFVGGKGDDYIDGGSGHNKIQFRDDIYTGGELGVTVNFYTGTAIDGFGDTDTFVNINGVHGTQFDDHIISSHFLDYVDAELGGGNDIFEGSSTWDILNYSWVDQVDTPIGIDVDLASGTIIDYAGGVDTVSLVDEVRGTYLDDAFRGSAASEKFVGRDGDDTFYFSGGFDQLYGGRGIDWLVLENARAGYSIEQTIDGFYNVEDLATGDVSRIGGINFLRFGGDNGTDTQELIHEVSGGVHYWAGAQKALSGLSVALASTQTNSVSTPIFEFDNARVVDGQLEVDLVLNTLSQDINAFDLTLNAQDSNYFGSLTIEVSQSLLDNSWSAATNTTSDSVTLSAAGIDSSAVASGLNGSFSVATIIVGNVNDDSAVNRVLFDLADATINVGNQEQAVDAYQLSVVNYNKTTDINGSFALGTELEGEHDISFDKPVSEYDQGNVVNSSDALDALKISLGFAGGVSPYQMLAADVNQDGRVTGLDALSILKMAVNDETATAREWFFVDESADLSGMNSTNVDWSVASSTVSAGTTDSAHLALLLGDVNGSWADPLYMDTIVI